MPRTPPPPQTLPLLLLSVPPAPLLPYRPQLEMLRQLPWAHRYLPLLYCLYYDLKSYLCHGCESDGDTPAPRRSGEVGGWEEVEGLLCAERTREWDEDENLSTVF